ncbi:protein TolB [Desulfotalea psychrophila]|nr:protein TolB [Desulfotalea psychrophila]
MKNILKLRATGLLLLLLLMISVLGNGIGQAMAADRVYLDITAPETRKIKVAVPWFTNTGEGGMKARIAKDIADTVAKALKFHGIISIIPTSEYKGRQTADWAKLGADYAVLGSYKMFPKKIKLEIRLLDVAENNIILGKSYKGSMSQQNPMIFKFCDAAIKSLTGTEGIASSRIAFVSYEKRTKDVFMTDILGRRIRQVTRHNNLVVSPRFTRDGNFLSYSSYHSGSQKLYITDLRQAKITKSLSRRKGMNLAPTWAPDGKSCILTLSKYGAPDLFRINQQGKILEQLTSRAGVNVSPTYSADGRHIVFVSDRSGRPQLYLMELETKQTKRLTYDGRENAEPNWSPVENKIAYSSLRDGLYQIFTLDPFSAAPPKQLTSDLTRHESPVWSPDGNQILFTQYDGRRQQIYAIMKNGSYQRRVFSFPGSQSSARWAR